METKPSIVMLRVKNFLGISDIEIKPGQINQICGQNHQGKTNVLKAIGVAVEGSTDGSVVKNGMDAAEIMVELSDETMIRRRITNKGQQSATVSRGEFVVKSPQSYLSELFDVKALRVLDFLEPKKRDDVLLEALPLKVTQEQIAERLGLSVDKMPPVTWTQHGLKVIDQLYNYFYQRRAEANKDHVEKKKKYDVKKADLPAVPEKITMNEFELNAVVSTMIQRKAEFTAKLTALDLEVQYGLTTVKEISEYDNTIRELQVQEDNLDAELEKKIADIKANFATRRATIKTRKEALLDSVAILKKKLPASPSSGEAEQLAIKECDAEITLMKEQIQKLKTFEAIQAQHDLVKQIGDDVDAAKAFADALTAKVEMLNGRVKEEILATVEMPVKGLTYQNGAFLLNGKALSNLSGSESIKLAVAIARKHAKKTKVICIDGCEQLDEKTFAELFDEISGDGFTYFLTRVGEPFNAPGSKVFRMKDGGIMQ